MKKQVLKYWVLLAVTVVSAAFIFLNSMNGYDTSHSASKALLQFLLPSGHAAGETLTLLVRKAAHVIEYAALGCVVMLLTLWIRDDFGKRGYGVACFAVLAIAVVDEHIQSFSDRTSSTGDILLDFGGALIGFAVAGLIVYVHHCVKRKREKTDGGAETTDR